MSIVSSPPPSKSTRTDSRTRPICMTNMRHGGGDLTAIAPAPTCSRSPFIVRSGGAGTRMDRRARRAGEYGPKNSSRCSDADGELGVVEIRSVLTTVVRLEGRGLQLGKRKHQQASNTLTYLPLPYLLLPGRLEYDAFYV